MNTTEKSKINLKSLLGTWKLTLRWVNSPVPEYEFLFEIDEYGKATVTVNGVTEFFGEVYNPDGIVFFMNLTGASSGLVGNYWGLWENSDRKSVKNGNAAAINKDTADKKRPSSTGTFDLEYISPPINYGIGITKGFELAVR